MHFSSQCRYHLPSENLNKLQSLHTRTRLAKFKSTQWYWGRFSNVSLLSLLGKEYVDIPSCCTNLNLFHPRCFVSSFVKIDPVESSKEYENVTKKITDRQLAGHQDIQMTDNRGFKKRISCAFSYGELKMIKVGYMYFHYFIYIFVRTVFISEKSKFT